MITQLKLEGWKSFSSSTLYVDPLTVLIGMNASGKSNALDAFQFLSRVATGMPLVTALQGDGTQPGVRGGIDWASYSKRGRFALTVTVSSLQEERTDFVYSIECEVMQNNCILISEALQRLKYRKIAGSPKSKTSQQAILGSVHLYRTEPTDQPNPSITARVYNGRSGTSRASQRTHSILGQLVQQTLPKEVDVGVDAMLKALTGIFILDPIPAHMRSYSQLSDTLLPDGSNIAGVLAAFPETERGELEAKLTKYAGQLPERDVRRIYTEPVGKFRSDAMLYCDEQWDGDRAAPSSVDARGMSDGTLRFLAILTALLTRPERSLLVVEEIDNGLHPSRATLLLKILRELGSQRNIDVVVTTHNPSFLDAAGPSLVPFITVVHRDHSTGCSQLTLLEDIRQLPKLLASAPVGTLSAQGRLEKALERAP